MGDFTAATTRAVKAFQKKKAYPQNGKVNTLVWTALGLELNSTIQAEFGLNKTINGSSYDVTVSGNSITINYHPKVCVRKEEDWASCGPKGNFYYGYKKPARTEADKYIRLFKEGIERTFSQAKGASGTATPITTVLGVSFTIKINVTVTEVYFEPSAGIDNEDMSDVIITIGKGRSYVDASLNMRPTVRMWLFTGDYTDDMFRYVSAHEFGHQVLGLGDAYYDDGNKSGKLLLDVNALETGALTKDSLMRYQHDGYTISGNDVEMMLLSFAKNSMQQYRNGGGYTRSQAFYH
jgi:hypothetical protein